MSDIVEQLRYAANDTDAVENASVAYLLEHAAGEIELLRGYRDEAEADAAVARLLVDKSRLTETEMDAMKTAIDTLHAVQDRTKDHEAKPAIAAARLMRLLDRLKPIGSGESDRPKAIKNQRLADYGKWLRTPYCDHSGCQCAGPQQVERNA